MRTHAQIRQELSKAAASFCSAKSPAQQDAARTRINKLLDERLEQKGVHPEHCTCHECAAAVAQLLIDRHSDDTASPETWGPCGFEDAA